MLRLSVFLGMILIVDHLIRVGRGMPFAMLWTRVMKALKSWYPGSHQMIHETLAHNHRYGPCTIGCHKHQCPSCSFWHYCARTGDHGIRMSASNYVSSFQCTACTLGVFRKSCHSCGSMLFFSTMPGPNFCVPCGGWSGDTASPPPSRKRRCKCNGCGG